MGREIRTTRVAPPLWCLILWAIPEREARRKRRCWLTVFKTLKPRTLGPLLWYFVDDTDYLRVLRLQTLIVSDRKVSKDCCEGNEYPPR